MGSEDWMHDLSKLSDLAQYADDKEVLDRFMAIKEETSIKGLYRKRRGHYDR